MTNKTPFTAKCEILASVWLDHRNDVEFDEFIEYNDLGLPLAYSIHADLVELNAETEKIIDETFHLLLEALGLEDEDVAWKSLEQIFKAQKELLEGSPEEDYEEAGEYVDGFVDGANKERERIREIFAMHMRWAEEKNRASEYMFWKKASEIIEPLDIDFSQEAYDEQNRKDGF